MNTLYFDNVKPVMDLDPMVNMLKLEPKDETIDISEVNIEYVTNNDSNLLKNVPMNNFIYDEIMKDEIVDTFSDNIQISIFGKEVQDIEMVYEQSDSGEIEIHTMEQCSICLKKFSKKYKENHMKTHTPKSNNTQSSKRIDSVVQTKQNNFNKPTQVLQMQEGNKIEFVNVNGIENIICKPKIRTYVNKKKQSQTSKEQNNIQKSLKPKLINELIKDVILNNKSNNCAGINSDASSYILLNCEDETLQKYVNDSDKSNDKVSKTDKVSFTQLNATDKSEHLLRLLLDKTNKDPLHLEVDFIQKQSGINCNLPDEEEEPKITHVMLKCPVCQEKHSETVMKTHMVSHAFVTNEFVFHQSGGRVRKFPFLVCPICNKKYVKTYIATHMQTHLEDYKPDLEKTTCSVCNIVICSKGLSKHMLVHTGEKDHVCSTCGKQFRRMDTLKQHETTHVAKKPHECTFCKKGFKKKSYLNDHEKIHTGNKTHACDFCGKKFMFGSALRNHKQTHGDKKYSCHICNKMFISKMTLKAHMPQHTKERNYRCDACGDSFAYAANLWTHANKFCKKAMALKRSKVKSTDTDLNKDDV